MPEVTPEQDARVTIDALLDAARWIVQSISKLNLFDAKGAAARSPLYVEPTTHAFETGDT